MLIYLLAARKLELGSAQRLNHMLLVRHLGTHRHDHLANVHTGHGALGFAKSTTHPSLEPGNQKMDKSSTRGHSTNPLKHHKFVKQVLSHFHLNLCFNCPNIYSCGRFSPIGSSTG